MREQWTADLQLLHAWAGSWDALAEHLPVSGEWLSKVASKPLRKKFSAETKEAIRDLRKRWEDEHTQSAERFHLVEQVLLQLKRADDWKDIERITRRLESILEKKDDGLCD